MHLAAEPTGTPEDTTVRYVIDTSVSTFTVRAFATGLLAAFGHSPTIAIPEPEGEVLFDPDAVEKSTMRLVIQSAGLHVIGEISGKDRNEINRRMREEVLEADSFPEIIYECSRGSASKTGDGQYWVALNGDLTLHGVKRGQAVSARVAVAGDTLQASGEFSVLQSDYEIRPVSAAGGGVKLKDELKLSFVIAARKQA